MVSVENSPRRRKGLPNWLKTTLAILVSIAILAFYLKDIDWPLFFLTIKEANLWLAFFSVLIPQLIFWLFSVYQMERTFTWFHKPFPWKEFMWVRGALYLVMMINTGVGGVGNVLYLQQKTRISWLRFIALSFFRASVQTAAIGLVLIPLTIGMHVVGVFENTPLNPVIWWTILIVGQLAFWDGWFYFLKGQAIGLSRYLFTEGSRDGLLIGGYRNKEHDFWFAFRQATQTQWLLLMIWAQIPVIALVFGYWYFAKAFNIEIPLLLFVVTMLLVNALQDLPVAFAGFGTTTMAWAMFYGDYASPEAIASLSLCLPLMRLFVRGGIGAISMRPAIEDVLGILAEIKQGKSRLDITEESKTT